MVCFCYVRILRLMYLAGLSEMILSVTRFQWLSEIQLSSVSLEKI